MAWNPVISSARNVMDNLILLGINCDADYTQTHWTLDCGWCVVCVVDAGLYPSAGRELLNLYQTL